MEEQSKKRPMPRWLKLSLILFAALTLLLTVFYQLLTGRLGREWIAGQATEALGVEIYLGSLELGLFSLTVTVGDTRLGSESAPLVSCGQCRVSLGWSSLFGPHWVVDEVTVEQPYVHFALLEQGGTNFDVLKSEPSAQEPPDTPAEPFYFQVKNVFLRDGRVIFDHQSFEVTHTIEQLNVHLPQIAFTPDLSQLLIQTLELNTAAGHLSASGVIDPFSADITAELKADLRGLNLMRYTNYLPPELPVQLQSGTLATDFKLNLTLPKAGNLDVQAQGGAALSQLHLTDLQQDSLVKWEEVNVRLQRFELQPMLVKVESVLLKQPVLYPKRMADGQFRVLKLLERMKSPTPTSQQESASTAEAETGTETAPASDSSKASTEADNNTLQWSVERVNIEQGAIHFKDLSLEQPFEKSIVALDLTLSQVALLPDHAIEFDLSLNTDEGETLQTKGNVVPNPLNLHASAALGNLNLTTAHHYLPASLPWRLSSGKLSLNLQQVKLGPDPAKDLSLSGLGLNLQEVVLDEVKQKQPLFELRSLALEQVDFALAQRAVSLGKVNLGPGRTRVELEASGQPNWLRLLQQTQKQLQPASTEPSASAPSSATPTQAQPPFSWLVKSLNFNDFQVSFSDRRQNPHHQENWTVRQIKLNDFGSQSSHRNEFSLNLNSARQEELSANGRFSLANLQGQGTVSAKALDLAYRQPFIAPYLNGRLSSGRLQLALQWQVAVPQPDSNKPLDFVLNDLNLNLEQFQLHQGQRELLNLPRLEIQEGSFDLAGQTIHAKSLELAKARVFAERLKQGGINFATLAKPQPSNAETGAKSAAQSSPKQEWKVSVESIKLGNAHVAFLDTFQGNSEAMVLEPFTLRINDFQFPSTRAFSAFVTTQVASGGRIQVNSDLHPSAGEFGFKLGVNDLSIIPALPYLPKNIKLIVSSGRLNTEGQVNLSIKAQQALKMNFMGDVSLSQFASLDWNKADEFIRFKNLAVQGIQFQLEPLDVSMELIQLEGLRTPLIIKQDGQINVKEIFQPKTSTETQPDSAPEGQVDAKPERQPIPVRIGRIRLDDLALSFTDRSVKPTYQTELSQISGFVETIEPEQESPANFNINGLLDGISKVKLRGEVAPFGKELFLDLELYGENLEMTTFSPYTERFIGYSTDEGKLNLDLEYRIVKNELVSKNQITMDRFTLGNTVQSDSALDIPVKFLISLLKDSSDRIELNIPVSGSLDDPDFGVIGTVTKFLGNLVEKAVEAPFALLGSMFKGSEELRLVPFGAGEHQLTDASRQKLDKLAMALVNRPGLEMDLRGYYDEKTDLPALKQQQLETDIKREVLKSRIQQGLETESLEAIELNSKQFNHYVRKLYLQAHPTTEQAPAGNPTLQSEPPQPTPEGQEATQTVQPTLSTAQMEAQLIEEMPIGQEALLELARQRAITVLNHLVVQQQIDAKRLFISQPEDPGKAKQKQDEFPRVELVLQ